MKQIQEYLYQTWLESSAFNFIKTLPLYSYNQVEKIL